MKISNNQSQQSNCLSLEGEITINEAVQLKEILLGYLTTEEPVTISLEHITKIDTSGLQLLYAAHQTAIHQGKKLSLENPSPAFMQAAKLAGLFFQSPTSAQLTEGYLEGCLWQGSPAASEEKRSAPPLNKESAGCEGKSAGCEVRGAENNALRTTHNALSYAQSFMDVDGAAPSITAEEGGE